MKKLVLAALGLFVLLGIVVLVGPGFVDWNGYKAEIARAVEARTGRALEIEGDIGFRVLPAPRLSVERLHLANSGDAGTFLSVGALEVHVALAPLLQGRINVLSVTLRDADIRLKRFADGSGNWNLAAPEPADTGAPAANDTGADDADANGAGENGAVRLSLDGAEIVNGTVSYRDEASGTVHRFSGIDATLSADSLDGPFTATGDIVYRDLPLSLSVATGRIDAGGATALEAVLAVAEGAAELSFGGTLVLEGAPRLTGNFTAKGDDLAAAAEALGHAGLAGGGVPDALAGPFALKTGLKADAEQLALEGLEVSVAGLSGKGAVDVALAGTVAVDAELAVDRFRLDELLETITGAPAAPALGDAGNAGNSGNAAPPVAAFALPQDIEARLTLTAEAVDYRDGIIRQPRLVAALAGGVAVLEGFSAQMPGGSDFTISGTLEPVDGTPRFAGRADLVSDNLRSALAWLDAAPEGVAPDRLRKGSFGADITASPGQVQLANWTMDLDTTRIRGGLTLLLRERPAFGLALDLGTLNLDAYLPPDDTGAGARQETREGQAAADDGASPAVPVAVVAALGAFDANIRIGFEEITFRRTAIAGGTLDATIRNGGLDIRTLEIADLGGARIALSGSLAGSVADPNTRLEFDIDAQSAARLARFMGLEPDGAVQRLGPVRVRGNIFGDLANLTVDASAGAAGGTASVKGVVRPLARPTGLDLAIGLQHPDANLLAATLAPDAIPGTVRLGPVALAATVVSGQDGAFMIDTTMDMGGGKLSLEGMFDPGGPGGPGGASTSPALALDASYMHPDMVALMRSFVPDYTPARRDLGPVALASRIEGTTETLALKGLRIDAGPVTLTGDGGLTLGGVRPKLVLAATTGTVEIDPWLAKGSTPPAGGIAPAIPVKSGSDAWSRDFIDTSGLLAADAEITLGAAEVRYGGYLLDNLELAATLDGGTLSVTRLASGLFGGTLAGTARLAHGSVPSAAMTLRIGNADVRQATRSALDLARVTGTLDYETTLETSGRSAFELVSGLQGNGRITVRDGAVEGVDLPAMSAQLKKLDRSVDFLVLVQKATQGGTTPFGSLSGSYSVTDGVLRSEDITLKSPVAEGRGTAVINLPPQEMDVNSRFWLSEHPNSPPIGLRLVGPLNNPRRVLDSSKMQAFVLQRIVERGILRQFDRRSGNSEAPAPQAAPTSPVETLTPEKALEGVLRGLLGN